MIEENNDMTTKSVEAAEKVSDFFRKYQAAKQVVRNDEKEVHKVAGQMNKDTTIAVKNFYELIMGVYRVVCKFGVDDEEMLHRVVTFNHKYGKTRRHLMLHFPIWSDVFEQYYYYVLVGKANTIEPFKSFLHYLSKNRGTDSTDYVIAKAVDDWWNFEIISSPNCVDLD